jgi:hypothetical protein
VALELLRLMIPLVDDQIVLDRILPYVVRIMCLIRSGDRRYSNLNFRFVKILPATGEDFDCRTNSIKGKPFTDLLHQSIE